MGANCCNTASSCATTRLSKRYHKILWLALVVNLGMFAVEIIAGIRADSVSLLADSLDFLGDAANYGISLLVLGMSLTLRARASLFKALCMLVFGVGVLIAAIWHLLGGQVPDAPTMGLVGTLALLANAGLAGPAGRQPHGRPGGHLVLSGDAPCAPGAGSGGCGLVGGAIPQQMQLTGCLLIVWRVPRKARPEVTERRPAPPTDCWKFAPGNTTPNRNIATGSPDR